MRRLKTLNRCPFARDQVGLASKSSQSGDMMDFGLLCFERGRDSMQTLALRLVHPEAREQLRYALARFRSMPTARVQRKR